MISQQGNGHWHNYFLQLGQAVWASVQSIFHRCLWLMTILSDCFQTGILFWSHFVVDFDAQQTYLRARFYETFYVRNFLMLLIS